MAAILDLHKCHRTFCTPIATYELRPFLTHIHHQKSLYNISTLRAIFCIQCIPPDYNVLLSGYAFAIVKLKCFQFIGRFVKNFFNMKHRIGPARSRVKREPDACQNDGDVGPHAENERM